MSKARGYRLGILTYAFLGVCTALFDEELSVRLTDELSFQVVDLFLCLFQYQYLLLGQFHGLSETDSNLLKILNALISLSAASRLQSP